MADVVAATAVVVTAKVVLVAPADIVTLVASVAAAVLLDRATTAPPVGAAAVKVTVPVAALPPTMLVGLTDTADKLATAVVAAWGVNRRVAENGPDTPAEFCARTRHHKRCDGKLPMLICETLTIWLAMKGAAMVEESST